MHAATDSRGGPDVSRRSFLTTCASLTAFMGLSHNLLGRVVETVLSDRRLPVIWLHFQECTGCSGTLLRASHPTIASLILDKISLDYHETLMAGSGGQAEQSLHDAMTGNRGRYVLVVEGAIPTAEGGIFCRVGGRTAIESLTTAAADAFAIICIGTCAAYGGVQAVPPNPTGAVGVRDLVKDKPLVNLPGCPPNPYTFLSTVLYYLAFNRLPELDGQGRPLFAYGRRIHDHCERRPHFDAGRFAKAYGDAGHAQGYCLYQLGCKGPATFANCPVQRFNDAGAWPVSIGHPCIGCTEPDLLFKTSIAEKVQIHEPTPFEGYAPVDAGKKGKGADPLTVAIVAAAAGAALGAGATMAKRLPSDAGDAKGGRTGHGSK